MLADPAVGSPGVCGCLECGFRGRTLRRHLRVAHGLEPASYYVRWKHYVADWSRAREREQRLGALSAARRARPRPSLLAIAERRRKGRRRCRMVGWQRREGCRRAHPVLGEAGGGERC